LKINSSDINLYQNTYDFCYDSLSEVILQNSCEPLGEILGINILPTYSFVRMYMKGDQLQYDVNKNSGEITAILSLGFSKENDVDPIHLNRVNKQFDSIEINLNPGDLCIFDSRYLSNSGPISKSKWNLQCFLHFVDGNGSNKKLIYNGRTYLGFGFDKCINNEELK